MPPLHFAEDRCPLCEQLIPHEELDRILAKAREHDAEITARLQQQFLGQKAQDEAKAKADLEQVKQEGETALVKLREDSLARESVAREQGKASADATLKAKLSDAESAKTAAEETGESLKAELEKTRKDSAAAIERERHEAAAKAQAAREEGRVAAESALNEKLTQAEAATAEAMQGQTNLRAELHRVREDSAAAAGKARAEAAAKEAAIRAEAATAAESAAQIKIAAAEEGRKAAEEQAAALKAAHNAELNERLGEQHESLEKAALKTLQDERAGWFGEKQKLEEKLQDVTRQLQSKNTDDLGDGAELDLFELLKEAFPEDKITRYAKGEPGADTLHEVYHNGKLCGRIVYKSKNASRWLNDYVAKLRLDQRAADADHAILSTYKLPSNAKHVHLQDTVIVCQPARVLVLAQILRRHILQVHSLRHSNQERASKTEALYSFITSARCVQFLDDIKTHTETLEEIDVNEVKAHKKTWEKRGEVHRKILRVHGDLSSEIDGIIGTGAYADDGADTGTDAALLS